MNLIVAVSANWGIGYENKLLYRIRGDQQFFKDMTEGKVVVMGHSTFRSLPGGKPLANRTNIVLSRNPELRIPDVTICASIPQLNEILQAYATEGVFIIGGESIYSQFLDSCSHAYITKIESIPKADTFFPNLDALPNWQCIEESETKTSKTGLLYRFCTYIRQP